MILTYLVPKVQNNPVLMVFNPLLTCSQANGGFMSEQQWNFLLHKSKPTWQNSLGFTVNLLYQGSIRCSDTYFPNAHFLDIVTTSLCPSLSVVPAGGSSPSVISTECLMCAASVWTRIVGIFTSSRKGKTNWPHWKIRQKFLRAGQCWPL